MCIYLQIDHIHTLKILVSNLSHDTTKLRAFCSLRQSSVNYENTKITKPALKLSGSSKWLDTVWIKNSDQKISIKKKCLHVCYIHTPLHTICFNTTSHEGGRFQGRVAFFIHWSDVPSNTWYSFCTTACCVKKKGRPGQCQGQCPLVQHSRTPSAPLPVG